jgi:hypothetical protein
MADFFKGLAGGFGTGLQFGQAMREREERDRLRQAAGLTPQEMQQRQASPEELARAQAETQGLAAQDAEMFGLGLQDQAAYAPQMPVQGQRIGPTQYGLGGQTFNRMPTQQEIQQARFGAMADVISERDPARAMQMRQQLEDQAFQARERPLRLQSLEGQIAGQAQQGLLTAGQITEMNRNQARTKKLDDVDEDVAQWQSSRLLDPNTNEARQPTMEDNIAALQYRATALQKAGLAKEATDSLRDYQGFAVNQIKLDETQRNSQLGAVAAAIAAGDLGPAVAFYDRYVLDGAKVTGMKTDPKTGAITVSRTRDDGGKLPDKVIKGGANELLASLNSFRDPMSLYNFSQNEFTNNLNLRKTVATEQTAKTTADLNKARAEGLKRDSATLAKLDAIDQQLEAIPPEEMSGPVARGLIIQRNAIVAGAMKQVSVGAAARPALSEAEVTNRAEKYVSTRQKNPDTGKIYTLDEAIDKVRGTPPAPDTPASDSASLNSLIGSGRDPFVPPAAAARPTTGLQTQPAPARNAPVAPNPYVDARGRPLAVAPAGAPSIASTAIPAAVTAVEGAVEGAVGTQAAATRYLQAKIARNEPLSPAERARAQQMGLTGNTTQR